MINLYFCGKINPFSMNKQRIKKVVLWGGGALLVVAALAYWLFLTPFSSVKGEAYIYIDDDDTRDSVYAKLETEGSARQMAGLKTMAALTGYGDNIRPGRYAVGEGINTLTLCRHLKSGRQTPLMLTIPSVRTMDNLAARLSKVLAVDSAGLAQAFRDEALCQRYGCDTATLAALFIPNTYEVFWTITPEELLARMQKESDAYWTSERRSQAEAAGLTPTEVITLASIVDQETANNAEKPIVAGMYLNRLRQGMKLQADPTVKFALKNFGLRRILHQHLTVDSPYNTYRYEGLPPGPIAIPAMSSIEAVLNYAHHDYIYMCAKEDFSGTHNFARTYEEHLLNAQKYAKALNDRGIH